MLLDTELRLFFERGLERGRCHLGNLAGPGQTNSTHSPGKMGASRRRLGQKLKFAVTTLTESHLPRHATQPAARRVTELDLYPKQEVLQGFLAVNPSRSSGAVLFNTHPLQDSGCRSCQEAAAVCSSTRGCVKSCRAV